MQDRQATVFAVSVAFVVLSTVFVALRFVSRIAIVNRVGPQDYLILVAWLLAFGFSFSICYGATLGLGLHQVDVRSEWQSSLNKAEYALSVLYNPALMATKTSILVFYLTLTREEQVFRWANYVTLFVVNAAGLALTCLNIFQCTPVADAWRNPTPSDAQCIDIVTLFLSSAPVNIITDIAIFFLPVPILTRMRLPMKQKIILIITFSTGLFVAIVDVIRLVYIEDAAIARAEAFQVNQSIKSSSEPAKFYDFSWYSSYLFMWSAIEINLGIICGCVPSLKPLAARIIPRMIRDPGQTTTDTRYSRNDPSASASHPAQPTVGMAGAAESPVNSKNSQNSNGYPSSGDEQIAMLDFLTAAATNSQDPETSTTNMTNTTGSITFFDFVSMKIPKSMVKMTNRESIAPIALTTILFFLWGFAYGFLDTLNGQFQKIVHLNTVKSLGLHAAYFGGYAFGPLLIGLPVLKRWGFKATFITGLCIYACGTLIFWPSAVLTSFPAFVLSNAVVGCGLAVLETAANPFIALCGPMENAEVRLNFSQGVQAVGSVVSPLLAKKALFANVNDAPSLIDVQWTYLGIALFDVLLAVVFYYMPIPEASDEDLKELADRRRADNSARVCGIRVVWVTLALGVFSQFCYVGGQESFSTRFQPFVLENEPTTNLSSFDYLTIGHSLFAVGRFLAAFTQWFLRPRWILLFLYIGLVVCSVLSMNVTGNAGIAMGLLIYVFEAGAFSIIFAISLRGMAEHTKTAAAIMTTAIAGGSPFPFVQYAVATARGERYAFCVTVAIYAFGAIFPIYLNLVPAARKQVDPVPNEFLRHRPRRRRRRQEMGQKSGTSAGGGVLAQSSRIQHPAESHQRPDRISQMSLSGGGQMHDLTPSPEAPEMTDPDAPPAQNAVDRHDWQDDVVLHKDSPPRAEPHPGDS